MQGAGEDLNGELGLAEARELAGGALESFGAWRVNWGYVAAQPYLGR